MANVSPFLTEEMRQSALGIVSKPAILEVEKGAVQRFAESRGYSVVREYVGHGVGRFLHEEPQIPNFGEPGQGPRLSAGMVLAIEPMVNRGGSDVRLLSDNWTVVTADGSLSAHFEHTILVAEDGAEILSRPDGASEGAHD